MTKYISANAKTSEYYHFYRNTSGGDKEQLYQHAEVKSAVRFELYRIILSVISINFFLSR